VDCKNSLFENVRGILRWRYTMTDKTAEGSLEPEVNILAEDAEHDVKEVFGIYCRRESSRRVRLERVLRLV
jgi:hypothetical protein